MQHIVCRYTGVTREIPLADPLCLETE
ncbi:ORFL28C.iORF1 [Human betaherpesvirus 5]|nr:ORFL28C.iORF1 [Human betaherpesvirus 5]QHX40321.1 ORFL28C.iORF1 [Human betaherpesvirus 5]